MKVLRSIALCFLIILELCNANGDKLASNDSSDGNQNLIPNTDAEKLAKCYDDNLNLKIERLERAGQLFDDIVLKIITERNVGDQPTIAQNNTLYFKQLRQTQMDMSADLYTLKRNFMHLNALNELFKKEMLTIVQNITRQISESGLPTNENETDTLDTRDYDEHLNCLKNCSPIDKLPKTCAEATVANIFKDGIYTLHIPNSDLPPFYAYCIYESKNENSWTIIQRRSDGSENFYRNWTDYKNGFGDLSGEYWLGLERMHQLTKDKPHELWILLVSDENEKIYFKYSNFSISNEDEGYKMSFGNGIGNVKDVSFRKHNNLKFATMDKDNKKGCAVNFGTGWWYLECFYCNLNGVYSALSNGKIYEGIKWSSGYEGIPKYVHMAIREM